MLSPDHLPTLWDPEDLFSHLALWAGAPAIAVAILVWLLGLYNSAKGWIGFGKSAARVPGVVHEKFHKGTSEQQRAKMRLLLYSVLSVAFSYVLAEIITVIVQLGETHPDATWSVNALKATAVTLTPWPSPVVGTVVIEVAGIGLLGIACIAELPGLRKLVAFWGGVACALAWAAGALLGLSTALMTLEVLFQKASPSATNGLNIPPVSFVVTAAVTVGLCLGLARFLPEIRQASGKAFGS
jgi:hypothetical protein